MSIKRNGSEFIELFALKAGIGNTEAKLFIHALSETVTEVAISEGKSSISGFGRFTIKEVADREGTQPGTGERIIIPAHKRIYFTPYKRLADLVNNKSITKKNEELNSKLKNNIDTTTLLSTSDNLQISDELNKIPISTESNTVTNKEMEKNNDSFSEDLDGIKSQEKAKTVEFKIPKLSMTPANDPETNDVQLENSEKTALLDELELLILQKKKHMMSGSLDIRVDDDDFIEQNAPNQEEEKENIFPNNITSVDRASAIDPKPLQITKESTLPNIESSINPKKYIPVEEDLLRDFIGSMDELKRAIKNISAKSDRIKPTSNDTISIDKKILISSSLIGVLLIFVSGFLIGSTVDQLFGRGSTDSMSTSSQQSIQTKLTGNTQEQPIQTNTTDRTESTPDATKSTNRSNTNTSKNLRASSSTSSGLSTTRNVRFRSEIGLYNMAKEIYGNPRLWVLLFEENFSTNQNPDDIAEGTPLTIPDVAAPGSFSELERERLRIALLHVAQAYDKAGKRDLAQSYRSASVYYPNTM
tara:strand:- start:5063 stop:6652 length:1590 start_codon:yes stop_codon:yes gene_type:complete